MCELGRVGRGEEIRVHKNIRFMTCDWILQVRVPQQRFYMVKGRRWKRERRRNKRGTTGKDTLARRNDCSVELHVLMLRKRNDRAREHAVWYCPAR
jgi:hypothetical protein